MAQTTQNGSRPGQDEDRKLFVGGLTLETTENELTDYFSKYGQIQSVTIKMNPQTGKSKGFAFIVFNSSDCVDQVLAQNEHIINNKQVDAKKAKAKPGKIFVGGITPELTDDDIKSYFSQFGNITQVEMPFDKTKNQRKGFCFITFESDSIVKELLKTPKQTIKDKEVDVKKAATQPNSQMGRGGGFGGRGGGRGGRGGGQGWNQGGWNQGYDSYGYGYDNGYGGAGGYDYYAGGYGGGYSADGGFGGGFGSTGTGPRGGGGGGRGRGRGGQRHQPY